MGPDARRGFRARRCVRMASGKSHVARTHRCAFESGAGTRGQRGTGSLGVAVAVVTGASGLVGSEAAVFFAAQGFDVVGIDNDMRGYFFGPTGSTRWNRQRLESTVPRYRHADLDIREEAGIGQLFARYGRDTAVIVH